MRNPVVRIEIENILGIERLDVTPGALTIVEGGNGEGKTSFLEAVRSVATEGHDPSLLRAGASRGLVRITLEDGSTLLKKVTPDGSSFEGRHPRVGRVSKARAWVDSLIDELGADPLALVNCPASKRAEYLADVMAVEVSDEDLTRASGRPVADLKIPTRLLGLDRIEAVRKVLYDERTGVNRLAKEKRATAAQLRDTLPSVPAAADDPATLRRQRDEAQAELARQLADVKRQTADQLDRKRDLVQREIDLIREEAQRKIDSLNAAAAERARQVQEEGQEAAERIQAELRPRLEDLAGRLSVAEAAAKEHARAERTREILTAAEADAERLNDDAAMLSVALDQLDQLKASLLAQVPVKGLEIRGGEVLIDGLPFDRVNTARQIEVAIEVAALRAKDVPLLVSDHGEALDAENWAALEAKAAAMGFNVIVARRTDGPLAIRTIAPAEIAA